MEPSGRRVGPRHRGSPGAIPRRLSDASWGGEAGSSSGSDVAHHRAGGHARRRATTRTSTSYSASTYLLSDGHRSRGSTRRSSSCPGSQAVDGAHPAAAGSQPPDPPAGRVPGSRQGRPTFPSTSCRSGASPGMLSALGRCESPAPSPTAPAASGPAAGADGWRRVGRWRDSTREGGLGNDYPRHGRSGTSTSRWARPRFRWIGPAANWGVGSDGILLRTASGVRLTWGSIFNPGRSEAEVRQRPPDLR